MNTDRIKVFYIFLLILALSGRFCYSQDRIEELQKTLEQLSEQIPALNEKVDISVPGVSIQEFIRAVANNVGLNISVDPTLNVNIINNFSQVRTADILLFLCKEYNLDISYIGNIFSISKYEPAPSERPQTVKKQLRITYNKANDLLSIDLKNDSLDRVVRDLTDKTGRNIILAPGLGNELVSAYIKESALDVALRKFAFANQLLVDQTDDNFYIISKQDDRKAAAIPGAKRRTGTRTPGSSIEGEYELEYNETGIISLVANNVSLANIIYDVSEKLVKDYLLISDIEGSKSINITNVGYEEFLNYLLDGTPYTFEKDNNVYIIGETKLPELKQYKLIELQYRTVDKILDIIPDELTEGAVIQEYTEYNSLLVVGNGAQINKIEKFIRDIDMVIPVILIEIIIVDIKKNFSISTGISAGLGENPQQTSGSVLPSIDMELSTESINRLLNSFNETGWVNLGKVAPEFYLHIKALEDNGIIKIHSTPKLSTLSGHEATMSSGETKYYKEEQSNFYGTQNPQLTNSYTWKAINADLSITIKPIVSADDQITLDIEVVQSEFTPREYEDSPPGSVTRNFKSLIRVRNQEMVLLGGLERNLSNDTSTGVPFLARIPVIKWFFSSRTKSNQDTKLNIFIQPTIIY